MAPQVTVIDEQTHVVEASDTFASLSQRFYGKPDYAQALQQYLQNDPRFSHALGVNGQVAPGSRILVPVDPRKLPGGSGGALTPSAPPVAATPSSPPLPSPPPAPAGGLLGGR